MFCQMEVEFGKTAGKEAEAGASTATVRALTGQKHNCFLHL